MIVNFKLTSKIFRFVQDICKLCWTLSLLDIVTMLNPLVAKIWRCHRHYKSAFAINWSNKIGFNSYNSWLTYVMCSAAVIVSGPFVFENIFLSAFTKKLKQANVFTTRTYSTCECFSGLEEKTGWKNFVPNLKINDMFSNHVPLVAKKRCIDTWSGSQPRCSIECTGWNFYCCWRVQKAKLELFLIY